MGVVNGINAFVPTMLAQGDEGHVVNTTSGNGGFTPLINSAVYATTKAAVTTITECLWGQLREVGARSSASLLYPSTPHAGHAQHRHLATRREPSRALRPSGRAAEGGARRARASSQQRMDAAGLEIVFAPLSEVADLCFEGIRDDVFWITVPSEPQQVKIRGPCRLADRDERTRLPAREEPDDRGPGGPLSGVTAGCPRGSAGAR